MAACGCGLERELAIEREALMGVALAWAAALGKGSAELLELVDAERERAREMVEAREAAGRPLLAR